MGGRRRGMNMRTHIVGVIAAVAVAIGLSAVPAHATVHEIVAQWCSGQDELGPPGISRNGSKNFAQPLNAARIVVTVVDDDAETITITFAYGHPAVKVRSTGQTIPIGIDPDTGYALLLDVIEPDPAFPAFKHCPALGF
jgi:hypothetical protein